MSKRRHSFYSIVIVLTVATIGVRTVTIHATQEQADSSSAFDAKLTHTLLQEFIVIADKMEKLPWPEPKTEDIADSFAHLKSTSRELMCITEAMIKGQGDQVEYISEEDMNRTLAQFGQMISNEQQFYFLAKLTLDAYDQFTDELYDKLQAEIDLYEN